MTLSICGIFKEVMTISAAGIVFGEALTPVNISDFIVMLASIAAYNYLKITEMRQEAREAIEREARAGSKSSAPQGSLESEDFELEGSEDDEHPD